MQRKNIGLYNASSPKPSVAPKRDVLNKQPKPAMLLHDCLSGKSGNVRHLRAVREMSEN